MIPAWNLSGVLPPFDGTGPGAGSPYWATTAELVARFAQSPARRLIFQGFLKYRRALLGVGVRDAFQWLDGSFVEDVERMQNRNPGDIDLVTFGHLPVADAAAKASFAVAHPDLFEAKRAKLAYHCDAYFVDMGVPPRRLVDLAKYWSSLFSHRRATHLWKGMVAVELSSDDSVAWSLVS